MLVYIYQKVGINNYLSRRVYRDYTAIWSFRLLKPIAASWCALTKLSTCTNSTKLDFGPILNEKSPLLINFYYNR